MWNSFASKIVAAVVIISRRPVMRSFVVSLLMGLWVLGSLKLSFGFGNDRLDDEFYFKREFYEEEFWDHLTKYKVSVKDGRDFVRLLGIFVSLAYLIPAVGSVYYQESDVVGKQLRPDLEKQHSRKSYLQAGSQPVRPHDEGGIRCLPSQWLRKDSQLP
jgi:hypothetical protein